MLNEQELIERIRIVNHCMQESMKEENPDEAIHVYIREIGKQIHAHAVYIFTKNDEKSYTCSFAWERDNRPVLDKFRTLAEYDLLPEWWKIFKRGQTLCIRDIKQYKEYDPEIHKLLVSVGLQRMVMCPVVLEKQIYGFVVYSSPDLDHMQTENQLYEIVTNYLAVTLRLRRNVSYIIDKERNDLLTGLYNMDYFRKQLTDLLTAMKKCQDSSQ